MLVTSSFLNVDCRELVWVSVVKVYEAAVVGVPVGRLDNEAVLGQLGVKEDNLSEVTVCDVADGGGVIPHG